MLLSLLSRYWKYLAVAIIFAASVWWVYHKGYEAANTEWERKWAIAEVQQRDALIKAKDEVRTEEQAQQKVKDEALKHNQEILDALQVRYDQLANKRFIVRNAIAAVTNSDSKAVADLTSCRATAEALGVLLGQAGERAARDARELEETTASVRLLLEAWPSEKTSTTGDMGVMRTGSADSVGVDATSSYSGFPQSMEVSSEF